MAKMSMACFLLATACIVLGAAAAVDYTVTCTSDTQESPLWRDAHSAVNVIRKEPLDSDKCCQLNDGNGDKACTTLIEVNTAVIKMCQPDGLVVCTRCDWAGQALLSVLRQCTTRDSTDSLIHAGGMADFEQSAFTLVIEKAEETGQDKNDQSDLIKMKSS